MKIKIPRIVKYFSLFQIKDARDQYMSNTIDSIEV